MAALYEQVKAEQTPWVLCHCDCYDPNFLLDGDGNMTLIDWEYSGMAYRGGDLGTFIACSDYSPEEADEIIDMLNKG